MDREDNLRRLAAQKEAWDIAVIGGGASGLGVALDALSRGLKVVLFEESDFAKGTSSRSTKLVHGGVRYLAQGDVFLVWEALRERGRLLKNAPHLTKVQAFIIPIYSWRAKIRYYLGLKIYDWMSGSLSLGSSHFISKEETIQKISNIKKEGLLGGIVYYDGEFDDARLALNIAQTCDSLGGCVLNYYKITGLIKNKEGEIIGLKGKDQVNQQTFLTKAKMVVNATGIFVDKIIKLDQMEMKARIRPSQGIHLVLDPSFLGGKDAILIPKTKDGRVLFIVPWQGKLIVGTTDTIRKKARLEPEALSREIDFILHSAGMYLERTPTRRDVLSVFAGMRPLAAPQEPNAKSKEISRHHKIWVSSSKLVTLTGGKWTTFRKMGEDTVDYFKKITGTSPGESTSSKIKIWGYTHRQLPGHLGGYGIKATSIQKLIKDSPELGEKLHPQYPFTFAEVIWAIREEMAIKLEDILSRRIRLLILDAKAALEAAPKVAEVMAAEIGLEDSWVKEELEDFNKIAKKYFIKVKKYDPN
ncbi:glycerol-3-phosphate dehydrogenase/oxidase [Echinicola jeungdonensis]|uniref:FAD-dependent oxidoreductase n=1 Tax=Echinicola jeungdonensis TaxID=709343 RepID=A0ABV5J588_9BACT|nr:glycerol-3-phosphate dehydrogenase/oxidase [Echinicola jeungdonensis]MDN3668674.1 glycerol-3-phosphate dehydrogenase/oxidase [Echinicola jeungdonensis]